MTLAGRCPASVAMPAWTRGNGVTLVEMPDGALGYTGDGREEAALTPQSSWHVLIGWPLAVADYYGDARALTGWTHLPGHGQVRLNHGSHYWTMVAAWRLASNCLSVTSPLPSLPMVPQLLQVVKIPHLRKGTRVGCRIEETPTGTIKTACRARSHAPSKATAANA
jgi:hypothetical protein